MKKCPQCHHANATGATECDSCGVQFKDLNRQRSKSAGSPNLLCCWNDHGRPCPCRAVIYPTDKGYCREHYDVLQGREPGGRGNYPVQPQTSIAMRAWDGWHARWLTQRDRRVLPKPEIDL